MTLDHDAFPWYMECRNGRNMIDIHCHPPRYRRRSDGSGDFAEIPHRAVADGITTTFCTPHIYRAYTRIMLRTFAIV